jgi:hypothetical protein
VFFWPQNNDLVHNLVSDPLRVADQQEHELINPWDLTPFGVLYASGIPKLSAARRFFRADYE